MGHPIYPHEGCPAQDEDYDLCFVVEGEVEFLTNKDGFMYHSLYLSDLLQKLEMNQSNGSTPQVRILLPLWATARAFRVILDFVNT